MVNPTCTECMRILEELEVAERIRTAAHAKDALRGALGALSEALELADEHRPATAEYTELRIAALRSQMGHLEATWFPEGIRLHG